MRKIDKTGAWSVRHSSPCEGIIFDEWGRNAEKVRKNRKIAFFYDFLFDKCKKWVILYDITKRSGIAQW